MTRLFCIKEDSSGVPVKARLTKRRLTNLCAVEAEVRRLTEKKGWTRVEQVCADIPLQVQFAQWATTLLGVNPRYVLCPDSLVRYVRGPNWSDPGIDYAHYEEYVKAIGNELWHEFSSYRGTSVEEAARRFTRLLDAVGLKPAEKL